MSSRPIGRRGGRRGAAVAAYMMALYRGGSTEDQLQVVGVASTHDSTWTEAGLLTSDWNRLTSADIVVSFANKGSFIFFHLFYEQNVKIHSLF